MKTLLVFTKIPLEGTRYQIAVNSRNVVEVTPHSEDCSWLKYWDGAQVRLAVIQGTPSEVADDCN